MLWTGQGPLRVSDWPQRLPVRDWDDRQLLLEWIATVQRGLLRHGELGEPLRSGMPRGRWLRGRSRLHLLREPDRRQLHELRPVRGRGRRRLNDTQG